MNKILLSIFVMLCLFGWDGWSDTTHAQDTFETLEPCRLNAYTERDDLIIGAVMLNWETGTGCSQNLNTTFPIASVGKLFIAEVFYRAVAEERLTFDQEMVFTEDYWMGGRQDCLTANQIGEKFTLGYLGNIMISCSDNSATWMLMDVLGWETVNAHIQNLASRGITGFGEVVPYTVVDRLKLIAIDPVWENVPLNLASQFYRNRDGNGLVPRYFSQVPRYSGDEFRRANAYYLENYTYNTGTPHGIALYMQYLRNQLINGTEMDQQVSRWMFNTLLLTQRVFSTQYFGGDVYVGSKNGFDLGYRAEVNITVRDLETVIPETFSFIVVRHRDVTLDEIRPFAFTNIPITDFLLAVSPKIVSTLYPNYNAAQPLAIISDDRVRRVVLNTNRLLFPCYEAYKGYDYLDGLQECWQNIPSADRFAGDDLVGVGLVLRNLNQDNARVTLIYTLPDGTRRSYQMADFFKDSTGMAWFEDVSITGLWRLDVFFNVQPILSQTFYVE